MNARVTIGTSKYHASNGSLAAPSIILSLYLSKMFNVQNAAVDMGGLFSHVRLLSSNFNCDYLSLMERWNLGHQELILRGHMSCIASLFLISATVNCF